MANGTKYGIVLGGGGAKGAYEIGVWKALNELEIPIEVVVGTSVGALNGAMMVQGDFDIAYKMWNDMNMNRIINFDQNIDFSTKNNLSLTAIMKTIKSAILTGGLDVTPLKELLYSVIDENKIRESPIDFGIVTFSLTDFKPVNLFKNEIPEGRMIDYLLASSCFPSFKSQVIDNKKYIDGGIYDNIPVSLLLGKTSNIIMVDVSGLGRTRRVDTKNHEVIYIKNSEYLGGTLQFDGEISKNNMELGYYDTLKTFGKVTGKKYYIIDSQASNVCSIYTKDIEKIEIDSMYRSYGESFYESMLKSDIDIKFKIIKKIREYADGELNGHNTLMAMAEICAECLGINRKRLYSPRELIDEILRELENYRELEWEMNNSSFVNKLTNISRMMVFYRLDLNEISPDVIKKRKLMALSEPKLAIANIFLSLMINRSESL